MRFRVFGAVLVTVIVSAPTIAQDDCAAARPTRLIVGLPPVLGQSPMWLTTGAGPSFWEGPNRPVQVLWIRNFAAKGPALLSGKIRAGTAKATFALAELGMPSPVFKLDQVGVKPAAAIKDTDLQKYTFHRTYIWFPAAGCYEMTARVGREQSVIYLKMAPGPK